MPPDKVDALQAPGTLVSQRVSESGTSSNGADACALSDALAISVQEQAIGRRASGGSEPLIGHSVQANRAKERRTLSDAALRDSLQAKLAAIQHRRDQPIADETAASRFLQLMLTYEHAPAGERKRILQQARQALFQALGKSEAVMDAAAVQAGTLSNLHTVPTDLLALVPALLEIVLGHAGRRVATTVRLVVQLGVQGYGPYRSARFWMPMLAMQKLLREAVPRREGQTADVGKFVTGMYSQSKALQRVIARLRAGDPEEVALSDGIAQMRHEIEAYEDGQRLNARVGLNMRENLVRMLGATMVATGAWAEYKKSVDPDSHWQHAPPFLAFQVIATAVSWLLLAVWAGPARERMIKGGRMDIDIQAFGPSIAKGLAERRPGAPGLDDKARTQLAKLVKDRPTVQLGMADFVFETDALLALHTFAAAISLPVQDVYEWNELRHADDRSEEDDARLQALEKAVAKAKHKIPAEQRGPADTAQAALDTAVGDLAHFRGERWELMTTARQRVLDAVLADNPSVGVASLFMQYLFKRSASEMPQVRTPYVMQKAIDARFFERSAYPQYKYGKALQFLGVGGRLALALVSAGANVAKAFWDVSISERDMHLLTWIPLGLYFVSEATTGMLHTQVLDNLARMRRERPHVGPATSRDIGKGILQALRLMVCVPEGAVRQVVHTGVHLYARKTLASALELSARAQKSAAAAAHVAVAPLEKH